MPRNRMPQAVALLIALTVLTAPPAHAQFGGVLKKAKQAAAGAAEKKVDKKVDQKVNSKLRPSSTWGAELTESSLTSLLRGLNVELGKVDRRDAMLVEADSAHARNERLQDQHRSVFASYEKQQSANQDCRHNAEEANSVKNQQAMQNKVMGQLSPEFQKEGAAMSERNKKAIEKAQKSGDQAAIAKANENYQRDLMKLMGVDSHADSLAIDRQCPMPREPASVKESNALTARENELRIQIRAVDAEITAAGVAASGMTDEIYSLAKERVVNWAQEVFFDTPSQIQEFGTAERKLLEARKTEIRRVRKVLA
jgi:hypothetical protein